MSEQNTLFEQLKNEFAEQLLSIHSEYGEITIESRPSAIIEVLSQLRDNHHFAFDQLIDICAVDYLYYGEYDWETEQATESGFSRAVEKNEEREFNYDKPRFAVVYHLLSTEKNQRIRVKVYLEEKRLVLPSAHKIWKAADWFEREAYDLYGVLFENHPDLRRILTDYGFIGHPFRKDFPLSGHVEMRYDAGQQKVIYEPVDIEPRILVPKVIRDDNRYITEHGGEQ